MCLANNEKRETTHDERNYQLKKIRMLGEKKTYKYFGIWGR